MESCHWTWSIEINKAGFVATCSRTTTNGASCDCERTDIGSHETPFLAHNISQHSAIPGAWYKVHEPNSCIGTRVVHQFNEGENYATHVKIGPLN